MIFKWVLEISFNDFVDVYAVYIVLGFTEAVSLCEYITWFVRIHSSPSLPLVLFTRGAVFWFLCYLRTLWERKSFVKGLLLLPGTGSVVYLICRKCSWDQHWGHPAAKTHFSILLIFWVSWVGSGKWTVHHNPQTPTSDIKSQTFLT